nr:tripartite tricarboxylate transporter substrate binding protein [Pseudothermotoga thermarum]
MCAGGISDITARIISEYWKQYTGQDMVVVNMVGVEGAVAADYVFKSKPDGSIVFWYHEAMLGNYYTDVSPLNWYDFTPACMVIVSPRVTLTRANMPWKNLKEALKDAKANPKKYAIGFGTGGVAYFEYAGIEAIVPGALRAVPYEGGDTPRITALLGGHIDLAMVGLPSAIPYLKSGELKALAVHDTERIKLLPDVPTTVELGYKDYIFRLSNTFFFPPKTPKSIVDQFNSIIEKIANNPEFQKRMEEMNIIVDFRTGAALEEYWKAADENYRKLSGKGKNS